MIIIVHSLRIIGVSMDTNEIINILENENLTLKFRKIENIPMGRSIHFSFSCPKEELSKEMIKRFGRTMKSMTAL